MEESFEALQTIIARRLIQGTDSKTEQGTLSNKNKKSESQNPQTEQRLVVPEKQDLLEPDFVRVEKNIAAFGFFTPSSKRIRNAPKVIKFSQTVEGNKVEAEVIISGSMQYGMPITSDQDKYLAFQKIIDRVKQEKGKVENPISFTTAELLALLGTSKNGNRYKEVSDWLKIMKGTTIESNGAVWIAGKKKFATDVFSLFDRIRSTGEELDDGSIADKNFVWLSNWYLDNLNNYYLLPIDFETYKQLKNHVAKALIPLLQVWLYASRELGRFEKRYSEICQTLNITQYKKPSDIKRFFGNSLNELVEHQYLENWELEKTADKKDFKIVFYHGFKFYTDRAKAKRLNKEAKTKSDKTPAEARKKTAREKLPFEEINETTPPNFDAQQVSDEQTKPVLTITTLETNLLSGQKILFERLKAEFEVSESKAFELLQKHSVQSVEQQLNAFEFRTTHGIESKSGFIIKAIENNYSLPEKYFETARRLAEQRAKEEYEERMRIESEIFLREQQAKIEACQFCDDKGHRRIKLPADPTYSAFHQCTHDTEFESQLEDFQ